MPLLNAFVEGIVCVGFNSQRGLVIDRQSEDNSSPLLSTLEPYLLSVITADYAIYPESKDNSTIDQSYPFITPVRSSSGNETKSQRKQLIPSAYNNLPLFCSPDGVKITYLPEDSRIHHIVFTQEEGKRSYAVVLTFQQKFILKSEKVDDDGTYPIESYVINSINSIKKTSRRVPSAYRHTNLTPGSQSYVSPNTLRRVLSNSGSSSDLNSDNTDSSKTTNTLSIPSRMRSTSNLSLGSSKLSRSTSSITFDPSEPFYLPHCVVLISTHPYWTAMHEVISTIYNEIQQKQIEPSSNTYKLLIQKYAFLACNTPIPPIAWERFSLSFSLQYEQSVITLDPPVHTNRSVLDLDLSILLLTLNIGKLLDVLAAILTQQSIIFFSSDYSKLVTTLECLLYLIYPFKWIHIYIPIVPYSLRDYYLEGPPGSYIMGVHSRHESIVEELDISLLCNLDNDKNIHIPSGTEFVRIPSSNLRRFIGPITEFVENIKIARSLQNIHTPIRLRIDEQRELERRQRFETNNKIIAIFLDLMVDLCEDTLKPIYWKMEHQQSSPTNSLKRSTTTTNERKAPTHNQTKFSKEKYLLSKTEGHERDFYRMLIHSTAFELFLEEEKTSSTPTEFRKICQIRLQLDQDQAFRSNTVSKNTEIPTTLPLFDSTSIQMLLPLPDWSSNITTHYLDSCIETFTYELERAEEEHSAPVIAIYAYLRGCALIARGYYIEGLRDLYLIDNSNLFPKEYIQTIIVPILSEILLLDRFFQESFYIESPEWKKIPDEFETTRKLSTSSNDMPPLPPNVIEGDLSFDEFDDYVYRSNIVYDKETSTILFKVLLHWVNSSNKSSDGSKKPRRWSLGGSGYKESTNTPNDVKKGSHTIDVTPKSSLPSSLFELFLDVWQKTNAEKARMNSYLPKDRQKQESILLISAIDISSKNNGRGKLILTHRAIYILAEGQSSATLVTELLKIVFIDTYQYKTMFSSSKPAVRLYAIYSPSSPLPSTDRPTLQNDSDPLDMFLFKDAYEQTFWYKLLYELWSGVSIAQDECDTAVLHKISRHIALFDTILNMDSNEANIDKKLKQGNNQGCIDAALDDFTIFTRMQKNGTFKKLTNETRKAFHNRLSPSINDSERHAIRSLILTESLDNTYSLLWCSYGNKIKIFNTKTWICDPNDLSFPSLIKCMCLDSSNKLWIGCQAGQLFLVDTIQRICGTQLALIEGGCQTMAFDIIRNHVLIANRSGLVIIWNTINKQRLTEINLDEIYKNISNMQARIYKTEVLLNIHQPIEEPISSSTNDSNEKTSGIPNELKKIQIYEDQLFACYRDDYILIFRILDSNKYIYDQIVSVKYKDYSIPINSFIVYNQQLWISASYIIEIYNINNRNRKKSYDLIMKKHLDDDHLLTMLGLSNYIWAGSSRGNVYIFRMDNYELLKTFDGHKDGVCCLCPMDDTYVISGSQQYDTSIVVWENFETNDITSTRF